MCSSDLMHSLLHRHNIQAPEGKINTGENREWWEQVPLSSLERLRLNQELKTLRLVREHIVEVEHELGRLSSSERWGQQATHIMQLPGVGIVVTMTILYAIGEILTTTWIGRLVLGMVVGSVIARLARL